MLARILSALFLSLAIVLASSPARAAWHKAESDRFVIYSDSRAEDLRKFSEMLERYHVAMELESGRKVPVPSPSNRLTIYMVGSRDNLRDIYGAGSRSAVAGFYIPRANGSVTFVPNIRFGSREAGRGQTGTRYSRRAGGGGFQGDRSFSILLHEYAHHFMISSARHAMPRWLSEGSAEYFSSARFNDDGSVDIGLPNNERAWEISQAAPVSLRELLDYELYRENRGNRYSAYYGRAWLLFHYLAFDPKRNGQLETYWYAVTSGMDSTEAAERVFGDLDQLEKELLNYGRQRNMKGQRWNREAISIGSINVSKLTSGHAAMMDVIIRSKRGVDQDQATELLEKARSTAANYSGDAAVYAALAEAEYDAGNDSQAIAAADNAIAADPSSKNAYVQKGYALFRQAEDADDKEAAYAKAMAPFEALNALEADHTQPLIHYYRSFTKRGIAAPDGAKFALERATQLAPFDKGLAMEVAAMKAYDGESEIARYLLGPIAADPHGGKRASAAQSMIDYLKNIPNGQSVSFGRVLSELNADDGGDSERET